MICSGFNNNSVKGKFKSLFRLEMLHHLKIVLLHIIVLIEALASIVLVLNKPAFVGQNYIDQLQSLFAIVNHGLFRL